MLRGSSPITLSQLDISPAIQAGALEAQAAVNLASSVNQAVENFQAKQEEKKQKEMTVSALRSFVPGLSEDLYKAAASDKGVRDNLMLFGREQAKAQAEIDLARAKPPSAKDLFEITERQQEMMNNQALAQANQDFLKLPQEERTSIKLSQLAEGYGSTDPSLAANLSKQYLDSGLIQKGLTPKEELAAQTNKTAADSALFDLFQSTQRITDVATDIGREAGVGTIGVTGGLMSLIPGTAARDLRGDIATIQADQAFSALQALREASPTGGALGQVSERELALLQSAFAAIDPGLSRGKLIENLNAYIGKRNQALKNVYNTYVSEYGEEEARRVLGPLMTTGGTASPGEPSPDLIESVQFSEEVPTERASGVLPRFLSPGAPSELGFNPMSANLLPFLLLSKRSLGESPDTIETEGVQQSFTEPKFTIKEVN